MPIDQTLTLFGHTMVLTPGPTFREKMDRERIAVLKQGKVNGVSALATVGSVNVMTQADYNLRIAALEALALEESVVLDFADDAGVEKTMLEYMDYMCLTLLMRFSAGTKLEAVRWKAFPFSLKEWRTAAQAAAARLASHLSSVYGFRHTGTSADFLKRRQLLGIKLRGHWRSDSSWECKQSARSPAFRNCCSQATTTCLMTVHGNIHGILAGLAQVPTFQNQHKILLPCIKR